MCLSNEHNNTQNFHLEDIKLVKNSQYFVSFFKIHTVFINSPLNVVKLAPFLHSLILIKFSLELGEELIMFLTQPGLK